MQPSDHEHPPRAVLRTEAAAAAAAPVFKHQLCKNVQRLFLAEAITYVRLLPVRNQGGQQVSGAPVQAEQTKSSLMLEEPLLTYTFKVQQTHYCIVVSRLQSATRAVCTK
jgi:hypothetical protein